MTEENKIGYKNLSLSRVIAFALFLGVAILNIIMFGVETENRHMEWGSVLSFQGPSYFFLSGLIPFITAIFMGTSFLFSYHKGTIAVQDNKYVFIEKRIPATITTEIKRDSVLSINLANNETGIKFLWLIIFIPWLVITYQFGLLNLNQPVLILFPVVAVIIFISVGLVGAAMIILFAYPPWLLQIYTVEGYHEYWFDPWGEKQRVIDGIIDLMNIKQPETEVVSSDKKNKHWDMLIIGLAFLVVGIVSVATFHPTLAKLNIIISWTMISIGTYIIVTKLRELNPGQSDSKITEDIKSDGDLRINIRGKYYQKYFWIKKPQEKKYGMAHQSFESFWGWESLFLFLWLTGTTIEYWFIFYYVYDPIIYTLISVPILFVQALLILSPHNFLQLKVDDYKFKLPIKISHEESRKSDNIITRLKHNISDESLKKGFAIRMSFISIIVLIAIIIFVLQFF